MNAAELLNKGCACRTLDTTKLKAHLSQDPLAQEIFEEITKLRPNLFSSTTVFLAQKRFQEMVQLITTIESVIKIPAFRERVLKFAPEIAQKSHGPKGVFMGYDFHLSDEGVKLIEINTNAGGALLNFELARAQIECCKAENIFFSNNEVIENLEDDFVAMFLSEWKTQRPDGQLGLIAIVDDNPEAQYLYPEFKLFKLLFEKHQLKTVIADPKDFIFKDNKLWCNNEIVDLVYNRLTDFYFDEVTHRNIYEAYEAASVVITPAPNHHALFAHKLNLMLLTDPETLAMFELSDSAKEILLTKIPKTELVTRENAQRFWDERKNLFFKPVSGFGSKATYRGDKITRKVWEQILQKDYVAQALVPPSERAVSVNEEVTELKMDIRAYVYDGKIQLLGARLYSGQTTNFRTEGGGFAPVFICADGSDPGSRNSPAALCK